MAHWGARRIRSGYGSGRGKQVQGPAGVRPAERKQPVLCSWLQRNVRTPDFGSSDVLLEPAQTAVKSDNSLGWGSTATASLANGKADGGWKFRERLRPLTYPIIHLSCGSLCGETDRRRLDSRFQPSSARTQKHLSVRGSIGPKPWEKTRRCSH
ncbi:uncharacterized protein LOC144235924 isoform X2 [Crocuta crocuta]